MSSQMARTAPAAQQRVTLTGGRLTGIPTRAGPLTHVGVVCYGKEYQLLGCWDA